MSHNGSLRHVSRGGCRSEAKPSGPVEAYACGVRSTASNRGLGKMRLNPNFELLALRH